ncbi:hypothetical protein MF271_18820 (plasmid) [Deinococcus sp. KNUC1210]|uniref:hypothetical protein n=1 Tax=Deinococcus sp. KNUC1210 TaxID=2917691 RepID=UPI001EEF868C|nr:hypothetical protein [Deinococcus sp. KNUC1210]ULH17182.1 hypothetical protein MF271_18820 [Deinococcus sp. KNUC1210]
MKHILFPTVDAADSFIADMQQQGIAQLDSGSATVQRRGMATGTSNMTGTDANYATTADDQRVAEEAGEGAVKGTGVGAVVGAAAGALTTAGVLGTAAATAATVATGGLALPVILGMAAAGAGVGAAVGAAGGAAGAEDGNMGGRYPSSYEVDDGHYDQISQTLDAGGRAVAVEDSISSAALEATMQRYGGHFV